VTTSTREVHAREAEGTNAEEAPGETREAGIGSSASERRAHLLLGHT
jgi:hypothetical protein